MPSPAATSRGSTRAIAIALSPSGLAVAAAASPWEKIVFSYRAAVKRAEALIASELGERREPRGGECRLPAKMLFADEEVECGPNLVFR